MELSLYFIRLRGRERGTGQEIMFTVESPQTAVDGSCPQLLLTMNLHVEIFRPI